MIRRDFLKLTGLAAVAAGTGFTAGKLIGNDKPVRFALHGFLPADEQLLRKAVAVFNQKIKSDSAPVIFAEDKLSRFIKTADKLSKHSDYKNEGRIVYRIKKLNKPVEADLIVSDDQLNLYSPEKDFNVSLADLRGLLKNRKADIVFTAEYKNENILSSLFKTNGKEVVVENHKGIIERIPLDQNYNEVEVNGINGKAGFSINNGLVKVHNSCCRNKICEHTLASAAGDIIACAPNRILIRIENV